MARLTPGLGIKGAFLLRPPFKTVADLEYTVTAQRSFAEIRARNGDPQKIVYDPVNLSAGAMQADIDEGAAIIVLATRTGELLYVPDTYIESYPYMGSIPYSHLIASASLGMIPDSQDVTQIQQVIASAISDYIGVEATVFITRGEISDSITEDRHVQLTISRQEAIKTRETDRAAALRLTAELLAANERIAQYELIIQDLTKPAD
jgi:hypothetical protein